ncbi:hypothetical protein L2750_09425 [Shewanella submarina]|uniref:Uncharacterized protein n=1 Tax=Shewanella submarina TaxID=2016376 RepID=A0ABV7G6U1_9GAMM|nr:hypothetical protein [Shewanella submarina]MCL1037374.1 hypothetical protein [Shewanella submarina]
MAVKVLTVLVSNQIRPSYLNKYKLSSTQLMTMKMTTAAAILFSLLLPIQGLTETTSTGDNSTYPWTGTFSPYSQDQTYLGIAKDTRWDRCQVMTWDAGVASGVVHFQRNNPPEGVKLSDAEILERLQSMYPQDEDNINDEINKKTIEIAFTHWSAYQEGPISKGAIIEHAAWDWCIKQPAELFYDI